jgi:hypothetical protein
VTDIREPQQIVSSNRRIVVRLVLTVVGVILWGILILWLGEIRGDYQCVFCDPDGWQLFGW